MFDEERPAGEPTWSFGSAHGVLWGTPLPFLNNGHESFHLWAAAIREFWEASYKDSGVDLPTVLAAELH